MTVLSPSASRALKNLKAKKKGKKCVMKKNDFLLSEPLPLVHPTFSQHGKEERKKEERCTNVENKNTTGGGFGLLPKQPILC